MTERTPLTRRACLAALGAFALPALGGPATATRFAAAWETDEGGWRIGLLAARGKALAPARTLEVPARAHGLLWRQDSLLAVARRPGDWLVRWTPTTRAVQWCWIEPDRAFNGHVIASADGQRLYTTETDLETGAGLVGVRDAASLEKLQEWRTGGMDPHELLRDRDGTLLVANGGIPTLPETGRLKIGLDRMDASLVRLSAATGEPLGQWRLDDRRLSLRHIAWGRGADRDVLGIALQAEHAQEEQKRVAPVLALFDGEILRAVPAPRALAGYGGDIAFAAGHFAVSCPRVGGVSLYDAGGAWQGFTEAPEACALAPSGAAIWAGARDFGLPVLAQARASRLALSGMRLDNHWLALAA